MIKIATMIQKPPATVFSYLRYHGGIRPRERARSPISLSLAERAEMSRGLSAGFGLRNIAVRLARSASTISREINRNGGLTRYRAVVGDQAAYKRARRPKQPVMAVNSKLKNLVTQKLAQDWSPEQISGWLKVEYPKNEVLRVSHETIYRSLYIQTRGLFRKEMRNYLRTKRKFRHAKNHKAASR